MEMKLLSQKQVIGQISMTREFVYELDKFYTTKGYVTDLIEHDDGDYLEDTEVGESNIFKITDRFHFGTKEDAPLAYSSLDIIVDGHSCIMEERIEYQSHEMILERYVVDPIEVKHRTSRELDANW